ncbi:MAG: hypothetical protein KKA42_07985 [candidate division Zixibacteria bacterium]|nr:hypothetical protein [candidate division Zixibacteria bacterium]
MKLIGLITCFIVAAGFGLLVAGCGSEPDNRYADGYLPAGLAALSPSGEYGLLTGVRETDHGHQDVTQVVLVRDVRQLACQVVYELPDDAADAGFCGDNRVSFVRPVGDSVQLSLYDPAINAGPMVLATLEGGGRVGYHAAESLLVIRQPSGQSLRRIHGDGTIEPITVLPASVFGAFCDDGSAYVYLVNVTVPVHNATVWDVRMEQFDVHRRRIDTLFAGQSCFGVIAGSGIGLPVCFQSSMPEFEATNVWQYDPATDTVVQKTQVSPPRFVSTFHAVGDSLICLVKDPSRPAGRQYRYEVYPK